MNIAIVDDIAEERTVLRNRLVNQFNRRSTQINIYEYANGEDFLSNFRNKNITIVFLDIYMSGANGIEIAKRLRNFDKECLIVFTTTSADHALEGFQVRATHYLVKPYTEEDIGCLVDEVLARLPKQDKYICINVNRCDIRLRYKEIIYAEHYSHMIHIHTTMDKDLVTRQSFGNFSALLEDSRFFICSRGVVVNLEHAIDFKTSTFIMDNGSVVTVSRDLIKPAKQAFMEYLLENTRTAF